MRRQKPVINFSNFYGETNDKERVPLQNEIVNHSLNSCTNSTGTLSSLVSYGEESDDTTHSSGIQNKFGDNTYAETNAVMDNVASYWQCCVDNNTGYTYYWNTKSNEVSWQMPADYASQHHNTSSSVEDQSNTATATANVSKFGDASLIAPAQKNEPSKKKVQLIAYSTDDESDQDEKLNSDGRNISTNVRDSSRSKDKQSNPCQTSEITQHPVHHKSSSLQLLQHYDKPADENSDSEEDDSEEDEELDTELIERLRKKVSLLRDLGGSVPVELQHILDDNRSTDDIIAEIEKEIPPDHDEPKSKNLPSMPAKPLFPILDYAQMGQSTKKLEEEKPAEEKLVEGKPLAVVKKKNLNVKKIKLSARARELIKASLLTEKARATNFVETNDGLKPIEEMTKLDKNGVLADAVPAINGSEPENSKSETPLNVDKKIVEKPDLMNIYGIDHKDVKLTVAEEEIAESLNPKEKKITNMIMNTLEKEEKVQSVLPYEPSIYGERRGLGYAPEPDTQKKQKMNVKFVKPAELEEDTNDTKTNNDVQSKEMRLKLLLAKCDEFLKTDSTVESDDVKEEKVPKSDDVEEEKVPTVENRPECDYSDVEIDIDGVLDTRNGSAETRVMDLSQLMIEKLKILNSENDVMSPAQVLAIQIETLVAAWQADALTLKYLENWLEASSELLKELEKKFVPEGWICEWDRAYKRYYYRNATTAAIQWHYPRAKVIYEDLEESYAAFMETIDGPSERRDSSADDRMSISPEPPSPPHISRTLTPPPPPVISSRLEGSRGTKRKYANDAVNSKISNIVSEVESQNLPVVPAVPPLPASPPEVPPPPPPPKIPPPPSDMPSSQEPSWLQPKVDSKLTVEPESPSSSKTDNLTNVKDTKVNINLTDELSSFYSDIATLEPEVPAQIEKPPSPKVTKTHVTAEEKVVKKSKKVKFDSALGMKKKGMESLVAKWQKVKSDDG